MQTESHSIYSLLERKRPGLEGKHREGISAPDSEVGRVWKPSFFGNWPGHIYLTSELLLPFVNCNPA